MIVHRKKRYLIHKAEKIIAISENTKKDICDFYNVDDDKITVFIGEFIK
jgi:hypothetical protein